MEGAHKSIAAVTSHLFCKLCQCEEDNDYQEVQETIQNEISQKQIRLDQRAFESFVTLLFCSKKVQI